LIIARLIGGLGNQMFQFAVGRALSLRMGNQLKLDITGFDTYTLHGGYGLNHFAISTEVATKTEIKRLRGFDGKLFEILRRIGISTPTYVKEKRLPFDPKLILLKGDYYLDGYWQSEKYFKDFEDVIRQDLQYTGSLSDKALAMKRLIEDCNAISVHIRRGDYVTNTLANQFHGTCSLDYYENAIVEMSERVKNPHFFIFSDDLIWCKDYLKFKYPIYFVESCASQYEDIHLMSLCSHHIIANSTFSWWGAWLNAKVDKIVIAPQQWFADSKINNPDILPEHWIRL